MKVSALFNPKPISWGLRGDPFLWQELKQGFENTEIPETKEQLKGLLEKAYKKATCYAITQTEIVVIERFKHGGMSSGSISPEFWTNIAIPLILERFENQHD